MTPIIQGSFNWDFTSINRLSQPSTLSSSSFLCEKKHVGLDVEIYTTSIS